ncbi:LIC_10190 family membrane protein [Butyrivibrio sp. WCE2006]|uniref:LIC_10190 family membrane protein n=1 Tax=Butyrivibrio sp. WCE2006 TaxID=1410611 RepID=UPI0005D261D3|nr:hypothetical protein [Butyrivibrio sp. WCE2006]
MLAVIFNWIYVIITTYITGFAVLTGISKIACMYTEKGKKKIVYNYKYNESFLVAGILIVNVYAEIFSLFGKVSLAANAILILACVFLYYTYREEINSRIIDGAAKIITSKSIPLYLIIFLVMAYGTSHGLMHYDTDLYHAQAIRWIEEFGVIKGLGNIHVRLGYNSASFALSALYSGAFMGKPMHAMAGYFALLLAWQCADLKNIVRRGHPVLSDFVRVMAIYYLFTVFDEIVSPASDYFMATMVFYIVIHWLDLFANHEKAFLPHALLAIFAVYITTIKLSAAPLVLLSIYPIVRIIRKRGKSGVRAILLCVLFCFIITVPYFVRNVILTGYLVYPFPQVDLFNVSWKIPVETAFNDAHEITAYGRGFTDLSAYSEPFISWFPRWVSDLSAFNKLMFALDLISFPVYIGCIIYYFVTENNESKMKADGGNFKMEKVFHLSNRRMVTGLDFLFIEGITFISLAYFIFTAPLVRYGGVYLWLPGMILLGRFLILLDSRLGSDADGYAYRVIVAIFAFFMIFKCAVLVRDDIPRFRTGYLVEQQEYNRYDLQEKTVGDKVFYYPSEGDRTGYDSFPSVPNPDNIVLAGDSIKDGFLPPKS